MKPSKLYRRALLLLTPLALLPLRPLVGQEGASFNGAERLRSARNVTPLFEQLQVGLRVNTASQRAFLRLVADKVEQGEIPQAMVNVTYRWALSRNAKYPFPYFQAGLKELAKRRGVSLTI